MAAQFFINSMNLLSAARYIRRVPCTLYRAGNATSPKLSTIRTIEQFPVQNTGLISPPPYDAQWALGTFPGASTFDTPFYTTGRLWAYHVNSAIPADLMVFHDMMVVANNSGKKIRHFTWAPDVEMSPSRVVELLQEAEKVRSPPATPTTANVWVLLDKKDIPPNAGDLIPIPESIPVVTGHVLRALASEIHKLEETAVRLGSTDESVEICEEAFWLRSWYHSYLDNYSPAGSHAPSLKFIGARSYHTSILRRRLLPKIFVPMLHRYVFEMREHAVELMRQGKEDESLELCDELMFVQNIAATGILC